MGPVGLPEMAMILVIALVLFGPKNLPELGRMLGTAISHFRRVRSEMKSTFDREWQGLETGTLLSEQRREWIFQEAYRRRQALMTFIDRLLS